MKMAIRLTICVALIASFSGCGLRQAIKNSKQADADKAAQHAHDQAKSFDQQDADTAMIEFNARRAYFYGLAGEFAGSFQAATPDASGKMVQADITIHFQVENDIVKFAGAKPTAGEITSQMTALSFNVEVDEDASSAGTTPLSQTSCSTTGVKPDFETGVITFSCQNSAVGSGRVYLFSLDDGTSSLQRMRTPEEVASVSAEVSAQMLEGSISKISMLDVQIKTPFEKQYFGKLIRK